MVSKQQHYTVVGKRIRLLAMPKDPDPLPFGSQGWVTHVKHMTGFMQVHVVWDNGRSLMLSVPPDQFEVIPDDAS